MSAKPPVIRSTSLPGLGLFLIVIMAYMFASMAIGEKIAQINPQFETLPVFIGLGIFFALFLGHVFLSRLFITRNFHKAFKMLRRGENHKTAIPLFEQSFTFFQTHQWVDDARAITLLSPAAMSYREMCLVNIAYCYSHLGDKDKAKHYYEKTIELFPNSSIASSALKMIETFSNDNES